MKRRIKLRIDYGNYTVEPGEATVDVWRDVEWLGQWAFISEVGIGPRISGRGKLDEVVIGKIAHELRKRGL